MTDAAVTFLLVVARVGGMLAVLPVLSLVGMPRWVVPLLSMAAGLLVAMHQPVAPVQRDLLPLALSLAGELLLGSSLGLPVAATFAAMAAGAEIMSAQMGLSFATLFDPLNHAQESTLGSLASWLAGLVFVGLGLHARCLEIVAHSFALIPAGGAGLSQLGALALAERVGWALALGVQLSGPILALIWLVHLFVALLSKLAPKMHAFFSVGTTATGFLGLTMLMTSLPWLLLVHGHAVSEAVSQVALGLGR